MLGVVMGGGKTDFIDLNTGYGAKVERFLGPCYPGTCRPWQGA